MPLHVVIQWGDAAGVLDAVAGARTLSEQFFSSFMMLCFRRPRAEERATTIHSFRKSQTGVLAEKSLVVQLVVSA